MESANISLETNILTVIFFILFINYLKNQIGIGSIVDL